MATVTTCRKFTVTGGTEQEYPAARSSSAIRVAAGQTTPVMVSLTSLPVEDTTVKGIFIYAVSFPGSAATVLTFGDETPPVPFDSRVKVSVEKDPAITTCSFFVIKGALSAGCSEKVHIYAGLESEVVFIFVNTDFVIGVSGGDSETAR
jgi:hypothetical protein